MKRSITYIISISLMVGVLTAAWFILSPAPMQAVVEPAEAAYAPGSGILDGMTFSGELGPLDKAAYIKDTLIFNNGTFVSTECEKSCQYPARPYYTRQTGDKIEFISETRCPYKDAKIVWRGTIDNGTINGVYTWTISRWYWTVVKDFKFRGTLAKQTLPIAENRLQ